MAYTTINKSSSYFSTVQYAGTGVDDRAVTGVGFAPDFVWIKKRNDSDWHDLNDTVRGATKVIYTNVTDAEDTITTSLKVFDSDGYTHGTNGQVNGSGGNYVGWNWKAGTTSGIDATGATITPTGYSFNATSKFSIIRYTGNDTNNAAVPHGLGVVPNLIIIKDLSGTEHWAVHHTGMSASKLAYFNLNNAEETSQFGSTANTSVLFHLGTNAMVNSSSKNYIAYCFANVRGYCKSDRYVGNNSTDGVYIFTGFRPEWMFMKQINTTGNWALIDGTRGYANVSNHTLATNSANAESSYGGGENVFGGSNKMDLLSNGFKIREASAYNNASGGTYIYTAFGQSIVGTNQIPGTAR